MSYVRLRWAVLTSLWVSRVFMSFTSQSDEFPELNLASNSVITSFSMGF